MTTLYSTTFDPRGEANDSFDALYALTWSGDIAVVIAFSPPTTKRTDGSIRPLRLATRLYRTIAIRATQERVPWLRRTR